MKVLQTHQFQRQLKKVHPSAKKILDDAVRLLQKNPSLGERKVGDLQGVYVYKFRLQKALTLLAYVFNTEALTLLSFGPHENFYRNLKR